MSFIRSPGLIVETIRYDTSLPYTTHRYTYNTYLDNHTTLNEVVKRDTTTAGAVKLANQHLVEIGRQPIA